MFPSRKIGIPIMIATAAAVAETKSWRGTVAAEKNWAGTGIMKRRSEKGKTVRLRRV